MGFSNALGEIGTGLVCLVVPVWAAVTRPRGRLRWFGILLLCWLAVCLISALISTHPALSLRHFWRKTLPYGLTAFGAGLLATHDRRRAWLLVAVFAWASAATVLDGAVQWVVGHDLFRWRPMISGRLTASFVNANNLASYLVLAVPVQLWVVRWGRRPWIRWLMGVAIATALLELWQTDSRAAWYGVAGSLGLLVLATRSKILIGLLAVFLALLLGADQSGSIWNMLQLDPGRTEGWRVAWEMFLGRPWFGQGLGTFMENYLGYVPVLVGDWSRPQYAHNCFLQILAEVGLVGGLAFLLLLGWVLAATIRAHDRCGDSRGPGFWLAAALVGFSINMTFDTGFYSLPLATLFWSLLGLAAGWLPQSMGGDA